MLLAIDVGNTNTVLGLYRLAAPGDPAPASLLADWRITTHRNPTVDEIGILYRDLFAIRSIDISQVTGVAVSSVVPPLDSTLRHAIELYFHVKPLFVEPGVRTGLPILTDNPSEVGADRIVNCVAALDLVRQPATNNVERSTVNVPIIVVDFGTATTFDVISPKGEYIGGAIAPGIGISADALFVRAARLPRVDIRKPAKIIGTNTVDHLQIGLYYGYIGLVDGILDRIIAELALAHPAASEPAKKPRIIASGIMAHLMTPDSKHIAEIDDTLTLDGLRILFERNRTARPRSRH